MIKLNHINAEPSRSTKFLLRATRKTPRIRGGFRHPGLVQTAHAARDVGVAVGGICLDFLSLGTLYWLLPFHPGICAGLIAFDIAGAAMSHAGVGDRQWRDNQIAVAETAEDQAAIRAQLPGRFILINWFGYALITLAALVKIGGLVLTPALAILGGWGPALIVSYGAVALIHWTVTGFAFAHLRARSAEKKELNALLRSSPLATERALHENRIKAERRYAFISTTQLVAIDNVDGHSLEYEGAVQEGHGYVLITNGRLDDDDLDTMIQRQRTAVQAAALYREGLKAQLEIEESEPMSAMSIAKTTKTSDRIDESTSNALNLPGAMPTMATKAMGHAVVAIGAAITIFSAIGCKPTTSEQVKMQIVALGPLATDSNEPLPERIFAFAAPDKPLAGKFVPMVEVTRLDTPEPLTTALAPIAKDTKNAISKAWKFQSPELDLAVARESLEKAKAGILATTAGPSALARDRLAKWATESKESGTFVIAIGGNLKGHVDVDLASGLKVPAFVTTAEAHVKIEERMRTAAPPKSIAVVLDPPTAAEVPRISKTEYLDSAPSTPPLAPTMKSPEDVAKNEKKPEAALSGPSREPLVIQVNPTEKASETTTNRVETVQLPPEAEMIGEPVPFSFGSDKLNTSARAEVRRIAQLIKAIGPRMRVLLLSKTDPRGEAKFNEGLAGRRAEAVIGALLEEQVTVERTIAVGERLSPDDAAESVHPQFREVRVFVLREGPQSKRSTAQMQQP